MGVGERGETSEDGTRAGAGRLVARVVGEPGAIDAAQWNALLEASGQPTPFMRHAYLAALHDSHSACEASGWAPFFLTLENEADGALQAACAMYLKSHSYGEYVFDWSWAEAWERAGQRYYPKLLCAAPFTPVPGARLLARDDRSRLALLKAIEQQVKQHRLSSAHVLFMDEADQRAALAAGWLARSTVQFHWHNRHPLDGGRRFADFTEFLSTLTRDKRKKIQQERRYVREGGIEFTVKQGDQIGPADWDFFYRCYVRTYRAHHSTPYLTREFFSEMARTMARHWLLFIARRDGQPVASSLIALDPDRQVAYGRYWGCEEPVSHLHFEACYYQPLQWCIEQGYLRFEGGAQGEHKMSRGLLPVRTASAHFLANRDFAAAVARFLARETDGVEAYVDELAERSPFKSGERLDLTGPA